MSELLSTYRGPVVPEWVDYNGHLRDAFYLLIFSYASDALMDQLGLDGAQREASGCSLFTLECHLNYLQEVKAGVTVEVRTRILGHDKKRLHIYHSLHLPGAEPTLAANEQMLLHVELAGPRAIPFSEVMLAHIQRLAQSHQNLPIPKYVGRVIGLPS
ncbi:MAG: hypothetical protein RIS34_225 [Pseudomonadota bacterium]|jgi:acyl-CoA thioester hydrolase